MASFSTSLRRCYGHEFQAKLGLSEQRWDCSDFGESSCEKGSFESAVDVGRADLQQVVGSLLGPSHVL
jgi:hypothetical protein